MSWTAWVGMSGFKENPRLIPLKRLQLMNLRLKGNFKLDSELKINANYSQLNQKHPKTRNILEIRSNCPEIKLITVLTKISMGTDPNLSDI